jgi:hypothetical protein
VFRIVGPSLYTGQNEAREDPPMTLHPSQQGQHIPPLHGEASAEARAVGGEVVANHSSASPTTLSPSSLAGRLREPQLVHSGGYRKELEPSDPHFLPRSGADGHKASAVPTLASGGRRQQRVSCP